MSTANWAIMILLAAQPLTAIDPMPRIPRLHKWYSRMEQGTMQHRGFHAARPVAPFYPLSV
jgi:hypothetical protein